MSHITERRHFAAADNWRLEASRLRDEAAYFHGLSIASKTRLAKAEVYETCAREIEAAISPLRAVGSGAVGASDH